MKDELQKKHQLLQESYERLYVECNEATAKLEKVVSETSHLEENLTSKVQNILKNTPVEVKSGETLIESVAKSFIEAKWKKDTLERKVAELGRELKQTTELKDAIQGEYDDLQANEESLLLEIQHLKSNLPSIPEGSEDLDSLQEEVKKLQKENSKLVLARENIEAELKNTRQQLEIVKKEIPTKEINQELDAALEANSELRRKIEAMHEVEGRMQEQLSMSLEKCKGLDENIEFIEELKLDLQNVKRELVNSLGNGKRLEADLVALRKINEELVTKCGEMSTEKEETVDKELLQHAIQERDDLEYDLRNMRKELDAALEGTTVLTDQLESANRENERLKKDNDSLIDQVTAHESESLDKVELLNTEKILLEQEFAAFREEVAKDQLELAEYREKLKHLEESELKIRNTLEEEIKHLQENRQMLENKVAMLKEEAAKNALERSEIGMQLKENAEKNELELEEYKEKMKELELKVKLLEESKSEEHEVESLDKEISGLKEDKNVLVMQIETLRSDLKATVDNNAESARVAQETIER